ncbi:MAG TPA: outer membrane protein assembly factor BamA [Myxococcota bacterium]|nr:outer membrane protein assembly factor BamA [Myxococcota bacterium]
MSTPRSGTLRHASSGRATQMLERRPDAAPPRRRLTRRGVALLALLGLALAREARAQQAQPAAPAAPSAPAGPTDLAAGGAPAPAPATPDASGFGAVVADVRVSGNRRIEADAVKAVVGTKIGDKLSATRVAEDVKRIYGLGFFHDVRVQVERTTDARAVVTYVVSENPIIRQVSISGNEAISSDDIKQKLTVTVGSTVDYPLLLENKARIEAQYQAKGYYQVQVKYTLEPQGEGAVGVNFDVTEGKKLKLREIEFHGNQALSDRELRKVMQTKTWGITSWVTQLWDNSGLYAEPLFYQDLDKIQRLYMDKGYIRVNIGEPVVTVSDEGIKVSVDIVEGPQFKVGTVDVLGDETMDHDALIALLQQKPGEVFSRSKLTSDVDRLRGFYGDRGFYDATVNPITQVDPEKLTISTNFEVKKGELYFVDGIDLHGNTRTADTVVRRELSISEGDLYSAAAVARSKMRVQRLGYFEEVDIAAKPSDQPHRVAMSVDLVEKPTGSFSFGAGFGSTDGFILSGSVRQDNLFGTGRSLSAGVDLGSINKSFYLRFVEPYFMDTASTLALTAQSATSKYSDFTEKLTGGSMTVSYPLDETFTTVSTGYSFSGRSVNGFTAFQAASLLEREEFQGETTTSLFSIAARHDSRDDLRFPHTGGISGIAVEFAGLGGFSDFLRAEARTTQFIPLKRFLGFDSTFIFNSRVGYVLPMNTIADYNLPDCGIGDPSLCGPTGSPEIKYLAQIDTDLKLPLTERYFLGGIGPFQVRGFKLRSLGPRRPILSVDKLRVGNGFAYLFTPFGRNADPNDTSVPLGACKPGLICNNITDTQTSQFADIKATDVIGGNSMMLVNLEIDFPISDEIGISGIVFLDMGNAFAEDEFINPVNFRFGTGFGIQWFSPFGPIQVVLGFPLDPIAGVDKGSVFEFSLGGQQY